MCADDVNEEQSAKRRVNRPHILPICNTLALNRDKGVRGEGGRKNPH